MPPANVFNLRRYKYIKDDYQTCLIYLKPSTFDWRFGTIRGASCTQSEDTWPHC